MSYEALLKKVERQISMTAAYISQVSSVDRSDAEQELRVAVWKASQKFNPAKKVKDTTFAITYIKTEMKRIINESYRNFRNVPVVGAEVLAAVVDERTSFELDTEKRSILRAVRIRLTQRRGKHAVKLFDKAVRPEGCTLATAAREMGLKYSWAIRVWNEQVLIAAQEVMAVA